MAERSRAGCGGRVAPDGQAGTDADSSDSCGEERPAGRTLSWWLGPGDLATLRQGNYNERETKYIPDLRKFIIYL